MEWKGKFAAVTGGANGIGLCVVRALAAEGAQIAVVDRNEAALARLSEELEDRVLAVRGDIARPEDCEGFVRTAMDRFGALHGLINNACLSNRGLLSGCDAQSFNEVLQVGVTAPYLLTKAFLPFFGEGAAIVNICSTRAFQSQPDTESYTAAKGGILSLTHALAASLAGRVRVNAISPGWIETASTAHSPADERQHPAGRVGTPRDIAEMALFLLSDRAGFITGQNFTVDGGMTRLMIYHGDEGWTCTP